MSGTRQKQRPSSPHKGGRYMTKFKGQFNGKKARCPPKKKGERYEGKTPKDADGAEKPKQKQIPRRPPRRVNSGALSG